MRIGLRAGSRTWLRRERAGRARRTARAVTGTAWVEHPFRSSPCVVARAGAAWRCSCRRSRRSSGGGRRRCSRRGCGGRCRRSRRSCCRRARMRLGAIRPSTLPNSRQTSPLANRLRGSLVTLAILAARSDLCCTIIAVRTRTEPDRIHWIAIVLRSDGTGTRTSRNQAARTARTCRNRRRRGRARSRGRRSAATRQRHLAIARRCKSRRVARAASVARIRNQRPRTIRRPLPLATPAARPARRRRARSRARITRRARKMRRRSRRAAARKEATRVRLATAQARRRRRRIAMAARR